ncbi:MAG TPA: DUF2147 domain-containing protein [Pseudolabrys sp.]|nr:DUF2147 domain-containing protein [Pseudolabrys sp.]
MKIGILTLIAAGLMTALAHAAPPAAAEQTAVGMWAQTYPDGRVGGWFLIFENGGEYQGAIAKMFLKPGENPNPICTRCSGDQKNQPSLGLVIIKGMQRNGLAYENGSILDPRDGQVYNAKMTLSPDGQQLTVRGYLGIELFGQNQVWKRLPNDALPQDQVPPNLLPYWLALRSAGGSGKTGGTLGHTGSINAYQRSR